MVKFVQDNETIVSLFDFTTDSISDDANVSFIVVMGDGVFSVKREISVPRFMIEDFVASLHLYICGELKRVKITDLDALFSIYIQKNELGDEVTFIFHSEMCSHRKVELKVKYVSYLFRLEEAYQDLVSELSLIGINI